MVRPKKWEQTLSASRQEAALAVRLYNDPAERRFIQAFVVHMHLAWLYLLHAQFLREGVDFRYRSNDNPDHFIRVDGEFKRWELSRCVSERWPDPSDPVRSNIEFFIAIRNRVEHRYMPEQAALGAAVSGHAQAMMLNFEEELISRFGVDNSMAAVLRFPLFIGTFTTDGADTLRKLRNKLPEKLKKLIAEFHDGMSEQTAGDPRFELRLRVVLEQVQRGGDNLAIQFSRWDDMTEEEKAVVSSLGRRGQAIIREQKRLVVGHGLLKARDAEQQVANGIPFVFNSYHFLQAWQRKGIRPLKGDAHPERTDQRYCLYDELSRTYGYTDAWVAWLVKHCLSEANFEQTTGRPATKRRS